MPKKLDKCVREVEKKISKAKKGKTYKCDSEGNPNPRGKHKCKTSAWAICQAKLNK
ncbi:MAG: hypothetical protein NT076_03710 [Candidatus Pacearchaeota archaeon]|nr:hypothetical protein [Candidatus Pacearchaeota archaeon]